MSFTKRLAEAIEMDYLRSGVLSEGNRLPSVRDLAVRYEASLSTVSQALGVLELDGLVERRQGSGTYMTTPVTLPSHVRHGLVPFIIPIHERVELVMRIYQGVQEACMKLGLDAQILTGDLSIATERRLVRESIRKGCQMVILFPVTRNLHELQHDYLASEEFNVPLVLVDMAYPEQRHIQVLFDNHRAGYEVTRELIRRGHRRIAFMRTAAPKGRIMHLSNQQRYQGYLEALAEEKLQPVPGDVWKTGLMEDRHRWLAELNEILLQHGPENEACPTALIALEDGWAYMIHTELRALRLSMDIAGFDNLSVAQHIQPRYLTTSPDLRRAGEVAVELGQAAIHKELVQPYSYVMPIPVIERTFNGDTPMIRTVSA